MPLYPAFADDDRTIADCVEAERGEGRTGYACIGRVANPCLGEPGGETTAGIVQCHNREIRVWDDMLNQESARLD